MSRLASILTALWAGSLWTICGVVAPTLFAALDDRHQAGQLAARFFGIETWIGVALGAALLLTIAIRKGFATHKAATCLILVTAGAPVLSQLVLGPMMDRARAANDMGSFGMLHGIAGGLFFVACCTALALVWKLSRPAE